MVVALFLICSGDWFAMETTAKTSVSLLHKIAKTPTVVLHVLLTPSRALYVKMRLGQARPLL